ncbi:putative phosphatidate phosphatase [Drosophila guanche]|uniref:Blast:Putative phosphatidate phosphatase n=1 Tax=Drosophila guanche TaxID=7266 RepID=A0A3B0J4A9_DROGU|nr:putative phosphatidate phosphatase [Drosophila guanche]SPP76337.1 blast:Putative phosphatidate phosphatase [Drosophila guanche]
MSFSVRLNTPVRLLVDLALLALLLILSANFKRFWWPTTQRGFFCNDESLMYPYRESTVSSMLLHWLGVHLPLLFLILLEGCLTWRRVGISEWRHLWPIWNTVRWFLYGHVFNNLLKSIGKQTIGRLRPHFFAVCQPELPDGGSCSDEAHRGGLVYHEDYSCRPELSGATAEMLTSLHVSFPSGHSSMAFYGLVFLALHLRHRRWPLRGSLLGPVLQLGCLCVAWFVAISRVMDYKHHWSDVVAGSLLGAGTAFVVVQAAKLEEEAPHSTTKVAATNANANEKEAVTVGLGVGDDAGRSPQLAHDLCQVTCQSSN